MLIEQIVPNLLLETTYDNFYLHDYIGYSWCVIFPHPIGFTPICTTDLARIAQIHDEFTRRNVKVLGLTCSPNESNVQYVKDILAFSRISAQDFPYPIICDGDRSVAVKLGTLLPSDMDKIDLPASVRNCLIIGPDKRLKASIYYPNSVGRNYWEILRVIDALQVCRKYSNKIGTPADWEVGGKCFIMPNVSNFEIEHLFPRGVEVLKLPSGKNYMKMVDINY